MKVLEKLEDTLQQHGQYKGAKRLQNLAAFFVSARKNDEQIRWIDKQNKECWNGLGLVQRNIYLKEELAALEKLREVQLLTTEQKRLIEEWENELETMKERYWLHQRAWHGGLANQPQSPRIRTWELSKNDFFLYSEKSKLLCKARGGCCEFDCGCCRRVLETPSGSRMWGHCTMDCGCCIRRRGFYRPRLDK